VKNATQTYISRRVRDARFGSVVHVLDYPLNGRLRDMVEIGIFPGGEMHARHTALLELIAKA
jgi:hypothetical protein